MKTESKPGITLFPISCTSGIVLEANSNHNGWTAHIRTPIDATSYQTHFLSAPTLSSMIDLIQAVYRSKTNTR